jgi:hypothetical protein
MQVYGANVTIQGLTFSNGLAIGGHGVNGGGGGLGAGGALFIDSGNVTLNNVSFFNNSAIGGNGGSPFQNGGNLSSDGASGGQGGGLNGFLGAGGGTIGLKGTSSNVNGQTGGKGNDGSFGAGGGGGGGGGGAGATRVAYGNGGQGGLGGNGGFGGGGAGGGGGGAGGTPSFNHGASGGNGTGGNFAGSGQPGQRGDNRSSGRGGGGAGLGGAIFLNSGAKLVLNQSVFTGNSASGGTGFQNGQGVGNNIFIRSTTDFNDFTLQGSSNDDQLGVELSPDIYLGRNSYTVKGDAGNDFIYAVADAGQTSVTKTLYGGKGSDTFIINLQGKESLAFEFNTQKLANFVNDITIAPLDDDVTGALLTTIALDSLGVGLSLLPGIGNTLTWMYESGRTAGEYYSEKNASKEAIQAQVERAKTAVTEYGTGGWGSITQIQRDTIVIEDFQPGLDTIILPSLSSLNRNANTTISYVFSFTGDGLQISVSGESNPFVKIKNKYNEYLSASEFEALIKDLYSKSSNNQETGTISTFRQSVSTQISNPPLKVLSLMTGLPTQDKLILSTILFMETMVMTLLKVARGRIGFTEGAIQQAQYQTTKTMVMIFSMAEKETISFTEVQEMICSMAVQA